MNMSIDIKILLETKDYLVINKPAHLMVHGDGKKDVPVLTDWIIEHYPEMKGVGEPMLIGDEKIDRPGIVHRLDEETSGALLIAKNQNAFLFFKKQFQDREIEKEYHAFVWGNLKEETGIIDISIGRNKNDFRKWHAGRGTRGEEREAVTKWQLIKNFEDENGEKFAFLKLFPKTGRTHQLRVHMKYIQRPIVSDSLYTDSKENALGFDRVALHAYKIAFIDMDGKKIEVIAPYPKDFEVAIARYGLL